jgi:hypothetical protein
LEKGGGSGVKGLEIGRAKYKWHSAAFWVRIYVVDGLVGGNVHEAMSLPTVFHHGPLFPISKRTSVRGPQTTLVVALFGGQTVGNGKGGVQCRYGARGMEWKRILPFYVV